MKLCQISNYDFFGYFSSSIDTYLYLDTFEQKISHTTSDTMCGFRLKFQVNKSILINIWSMEFYYHKWLAGFLQIHI